MVEGRISVGFEVGWEVVELAVVKGFKSSFIVVLGFLLQAVKNPTL